MNDKELEVLLKEHLYPKLSQTDWNAYKAVNPLVGKILSAMKEEQIRTLKK